MRTRCPACQTVFRITTEQIKIRAGTVRCGHCQFTFNALDNLFGENMESPLSFPDIDINAPPVGNPPPSSGVDTSLPPLEITILPPWRESDEPDNAEETRRAEGISGFSVPALEQDSRPPPGEKTPVTTSTTEELGKAAGLISPRATSEIPGYSKWAEESIAYIPLPEEKPLRWPFALAGVLLALLFGGQAIFHYRTELAVSFPQQRPLLEAFSRALNSKLPLPAHVDLVSIETSDLQNDAARNLLVLNATLRNRASYGQLYPSLELSLTDTQDTAIARRVFSPKEYLPPKLPADQPFAGNSDVAVRLWIDASDVGAAGYRLYVFYP